MALPEVSTLKEGDALESQRNAPFETENLPSPKGFEGPQVAPIPVPGTGLTTGKSGGFSQDFTSAVLGTQDKITPGKLPSFTASNVFNPRYNSILPGEDSEEAFALAQPWYKKWGNAFTKMLATTAGTFVNGLTAIPDTVASIHAGTPYDTTEGNAIDGWLKNLEDEFPNYYTHEQQEHPFRAALPWSGGFANFWGDKVLKNFGFTLGAIGGAVVQDAGIGLLTEGIGEIPLIGSQVGKAALWLNKVFTGEDKVNDLLSLGKAAGRTEEQLTSLKGLAQAAAATKVVNGTRFALNLYGAAASEAGIEARDGYRTVKDDLIKAYQNDKGYSPVGKELEDIEKYASASGNVRFGINLALLGVSDAINFDAILKPFSVARNGWRSTIQKELEEGGRSAVRLAEGSLDTFEQAVPKGAVGKIWSKIRPYGPAVLSEGIYEEGGQYAAQVGTQNYYERKYMYDKGVSTKDYTKDDTPWNARDQINNILHSTINGLAGEFGTDEGLENIFLGAITGVISAGFEHFMDRHEIGRQRDAVLKMLNTQGVTGILQNNYDSTVRSHRVAEDMKQAAQTGDIFRYKNFQNEQFVNFVLSGLKAGRFDVRMEQLNLLQGMDNDEFKKAFGLDKTTENVKTAQEYIDTLKEKAKSVKKTYDLINDSFQNPYQFNTKAKTDEDNIENQKHLQFESWKDELTQLASIIPDVHQRLNSIETDVKNISQYITLDQIATLTDRDSLVQYQKELKEQATLLEKGLKDDLSANKREDRERLDSLTKKVNQIDKALSSPSGSSEYNKMFADVLNYQINGDKDGKIAIPQESIAKLISFGTDVNRLNKFRESANQAFDKLSTEEGFNKYFNDINRGQATEASKQDAQPKAQQQQNTPPKPEEVVKKISIKDKKGNEKTFEKDKEYFVNLEGKEGSNLEKVKVIGQTKDGVTVLKEDGTQQVISADNFFVEDKLSTELKDELNSATNQDDIAPPDLTPSGTPESYRGESKKDLSFGTQATTDPPYDDLTTPDNNFQRRHQNFLYNLGSTNPKEFDQDNKPKLRIIPVTAKTAVEFGFPANWLEGADATIDNAPIRAVYVIDDQQNIEYTERDKKSILKAVLSSPSFNEGGISDPIKNMFRSDPEGGIDFIFDQYLAGGATREELRKTFPEDVLTQILAYKEGGGIFFVGENGEKIGKIQYNIDPKKVIYSNFSNTNLQFGNGPRYTNKQGLNEKEVQDWWRKEREQLLNNGFQSTPLYQFQVSRGKPNIINSNAKNSVLEVGLVQEEDLDKPVITIATKGNVAVLGAYNAEGTGVESTKESVNMPLGTPLLNYGGNLNFLNNSQFNPTQSKNIFELLKLLSDRAFPKSDKSAIFKYLNKIIHLANPEKNLSATQSSITINGSNLFLGTSKIPIQMTVSSLEENKYKIDDFLINSYHNVNVTEINRLAKNPKANDLQFIELVAKDGKLEQGTTWKNYNHYLLSDKTPDGKNRGQAPLTTNIAIPQEGEVPIIQKYSVIKNDEYDSGVFDREIPPTPAVIDTPNNEETGESIPLKVEWIEVNLGGENNKIKLGFSNIVRDKDGNITDITPVGKVNEDESITPFKKPEVVKDIILKELIEKEKKVGIKNKEQGVEEKQPAKIEVGEPIAPTGEAPTEVAEISWVEVNTPQGTIKLGFKNVIRDINGNITDLTPVGRITDENDVVPYRNPAVVKEIILENLRENEIKQDETNSDNEDDGLGNSSITRGADPQYRLFTASTNFYKVANLEQEFAEFRRMLPGVDIKKVDDILRTTSGGLAWGAFENAMVYIYQKAEVGTTYHEAFEAVWGTFLKGKEQQDLYNEFTKREGNFRTYDGKTKDFATAAVKEAKEQMAEEFKDFKAENRSPKNAIERFFQKIIDFIKRFIFGDKTAQTELFNKINRGYYRNYSTSLRDVTQQPQYSSVRTGLEKFSETFIQDTIQGMTSEMFTNLYGDNRDIINQLEEKPELAAKTIYDKLHSILKFYFEDNITSGVSTLFTEFNDRVLKAKDDSEKAILRQQYKTIKQGWRDINDKWGDFVREHGKFLKQFNFEYEVNDEGDIAIANEDDVDDTENKNQSDYTRDILTLDAKNSMSSKVKLLGATIADSTWKDVTKQSIGATRSNETVIKRDNSVLTLPKLTPYAKLFNYLFHNVSNINGIYAMWDRMKEMVGGDNRKNIDANVQKLMNRLDFEKGFEGKTIQASRIIIAYEGAMAKQKPSFVRQFVDYLGNTYFKTSVLNSKIDIVKSAWIAAIKGSGVVKETAGGNFVFSPSVKNIGDNLQFLNKIGIAIDKKDYQRLKGANLTNFNKAVNTVRNIIEEAADKKTQIPIISSKQIDFDSRLNDLAQIYVNNMVGDDSQSQHPNLDNEPTSNFILNNWVSTVLSDANNSFTKEEFMDKVGNNYFKDIFHQDSFLLNKILFDKDGVQNRPVEVTVVEGRQSWNQDNKSASRMTEAERQLYEINNNFRGTFYTLLPADSKTEWAITPGTYYSATAFFGDTTSRENEFSKFSYQMYNWLKTEVALARDYNNRKFISNLNKKYGDRVVGNSLRFFADLLPEEVVNKIHNSVINAGIDLEDVYTESEMRAQMKEVVMDKAKATLKNLADWNLINYNAKANTFVLYGFDREFLDTHFTKNKKIFTEAEALRLLGFREMNYITNNIDIHKFFVGDPAQFDTVKQDELKRIKSFLSGRDVTHVDTLDTSEGYNQMANRELNRVKGIDLKPEDPGYHLFKNHMNTFTTEDIEFESDAYEEIKAAIGERLAKSYLKGNEADAQALIMFAAYRELMYKGGDRFSSDQEAYYQWAMAWERNDKAENGLYTYTSNSLKNADKDILKAGEPQDVHFQPLKLISSGIQYNNENNVAISSLDKASWSPLVYQWHKGTALGDLHDTMQKRGSDYMRMESAHKVGIQEQALTKMYNEDGKINIEGIKALQDESIPLKQLGVQVEQSKKDKGQTEGSQTRKIVPSDLSSNGVPLDFLNTFGTEDEAYTAWNNLTEDQKRENSTLYSKIQRHEEALKQLTGERTDQTMRKLGIEKQGDTWIIPDKSKVSKFILSELERRELPRNIAYGLEVDPITKDFVQPLEANAQYSKIRDIIYSVMEKTVMRPKVNGGQKTMVSVTGWEKSSRIVKKEINGKPVYTSSALKFYKRGDSETEACEIMIPYWFGKQLQAMGSGRTKEEILTYLNKTEEGQKLLRGIGFRIPTQGLNSIDFFKVKDFLPEAMGDVIVLPSEITVKAGSDFDIDKLNTYLRNFYVDGETGYPKAIKYQGSKEKTVEYLGKLFDNGDIISKKQRNQLEKYLKEEMEDPITKFFQSLPGMQNYFDKEDLTQDFFNEKGIFKDQLINKLYIQSLENEYFDSIEDILKTPDAYNRLVTPNDASELKGIRSEIKKLKGEGKESKFGIYGKLLDSNFMMKERQAYISSKNIVGTSAVSQVMHSVGQNTPGGLLINSPFIQARFPHNEVNGKISLSGIKTTGKDNYISNINSQVTDGGVDVAKDKFLAEMGITSDTLSTFLATTRMGATPMWSVLFLNQPAIQEYLKTKAIHDSVSQVNPTVKKLAGWQLLNKIYPKFGGMDRKKTKLNNKPSEYTQKQMEEMITKITEGKQLTKEEQTLQLQMLDDYLKYNSLGWDMFHYYQGANWDTAMLGDPNEMRLKQLKYEKANDLMVSPVNKMLANSFIGAMKENAERLDEGLRSLINVQTGAAGSIVQDVAKDIFNQKGLNKYSRPRILLALEGSMVDYSVQTNSNISGKSLNNYIYSLLLGERPTAKYLEAIQKMADKRLANNPFLKNLLPNIDERKSFPSLITMMEREYDAYTSNVWTDAFRELKDDATVVKINNNPVDDRTVAQVFRNMVLTSMLESGSKRTRNSFTHLIPNEIYSEFTNSALKNLHLEGFYENHIFYRNNWRDNDIVPTIYPEANDPNNPDSGSSFKFLRGKENSFIEAMAQIMGVLKPPAILNAPAWQYKDKKVIKIVDQQRDTNTNQVIGQTIRLFARVDVQGEDGPTPLVVTKKRVVFKEINKWGDDNVQEYHEGTAQSILPNNIKVNEIDNDKLLYAMYKAGWKTNAADDITQVIVAENETGDEGPDMDEDGNETPEPDPNQPEGPVEPLAFTGEPQIQDEPETDLGECGSGGKFTVKTKKE